MSSALVRQALEFVDPDESSGKRKKRGGARPQSSAGQELPNQKNQKKSNSQKQKGKEVDSRVTQEVISKLLKLSKPTLDKKIANKFSNTELPNQKNQKKSNSQKQKGKEVDSRVTQEVISKLLKLSKPTLDKKIANKIVKRAATGKPVGDKIKVKTEQQKSILFPDEDFKQFERTPFCS